MSQPQSGKKIQNYIFNYSDFLGKGNFSKCYKATNTITKEQVAIKIVELNSLKSKKLEELLFSQIAVLKQLDHPNVLRCFQVFTSNRNCYIITQLCNEGDLEGKIKKTGRLKQRDIQDVVADVYSGLSYMGSKGIVHRDLKISNIFLKDGVAKIADFGFAVYSNNSFKDMNIGSPLYMSPEGFLKNTYGPKTDVWAFGIMVYELFTNRTPFSGCVTQKQLKASIVTPIRYNDLKSSIPHEAKQLILSCIKIQEQLRPLISGLSANAFIQKCQRDRNNSSSNHLRLVSPPVMQSIPIAEPYSAGRGRGAQRVQNVFKSQEHNRPQVGVKSPQKFTFTGNNNLNNINLNNSTQFNSTSNFRNTNRSFHQQQNMSNTLSYNFQSPKSNRKAAFPIDASRDINASLTLSPPYLISPNQRINRTETITPQTTKKGPHLINCQINFKQSVSILHYCRIIFKYLGIYKDFTSLKESYQKRHYAVLGQYLLSVLEEMYSQIINKAVKCDGENPDMRQRKLTEVTDEYLRKYAKELDQNLLRSYISDEQRGDLNIKKIKQSISNSVNSLIVGENCSNLQAIVGELLLTIYSSTILLDICWNKKNYSQFPKNKEIEEVLNKNKVTFNFTSFMNHKNKVFNSGKAAIY